MSSSSDLAIAVEEIDPATAETYLSLNENNRALRNKRVRTYAEQMRRHQWQLIGDPIRFDDEGNLLDGQHRLMAVIASGVTTKFLVIRNLKPDSFKVIDQGMNRTPGDVLGPNISARSHKAAAIRLMYVIEAGGDPRKSEDSGAVTRTDISDYYSNHAQKIEAAASIGQQMYGHVGGNRSAWIALAALIHRSDTEMVSKFFDGVRFGAGLQVGDPRLALRNWLGNHVNLRKTTKSGDHLALYVRAWNDWVSGTKRLTMRASTGSENFPQILQIAKPSTPSDASNV